MKKIILSTALLGAFAVTAKAQISIAPEAGINISNTTSKYEFGGTTYESETESKIGLKAGAVVNIPVVKGFFIQPGLFYSMKGNKITEETNGIDVKVTTSLNYLEVPVNLGYEFDFGNAGGVFVTAGPYLGYAFSGKRKGEGSFGGTTVSVDDDVEFGSGTNEMKRLDYGVNFSAGYRSPFGVYVRAQYGLGLANLANPEGATTKNKVLAFSVGYAFSIGGK